MKENITQVVYKNQRAVLLQRSITLMVITGPDQGASCILASRRVRVGTAEDNDLILSDPQVSRHHLELRVQDRSYLVIDLQSTNGTFCRGARIREAEVDVGAEIRLGTTTLRVEAGSVSSTDVSESGFGRLIGSAASLQRIYGVLAAVSPTDTTVLIEGETGTGKELVAHQIHQQSPRADQMFGVLDCGSLPPGLIESELFGHERGAFTGASEARDGVFEMCSGGTVFLDEIGELPLDIQTRLLRVLDDRTIQRVGDGLRRRVDVRLIAATNRTLADEVREGRFRQDLYYRLAVVRVVLPPLRERREDIPTLARHFLCQVGCVDPDTVLTPEVLEALASRRWKGNVRELRNAIERAMVLSEGCADLLESEESLVLSQIADGAKKSAPDPVAAQEISGIGLARILPPQLYKLPFKDLKRMLLEELENLYIGQLQRQHGSNISSIAADAQVDRHLVRKVLRRLEQR